MHLTLTFKVNGNSLRLLYPPAAFPAGRGEKSKASVALRILGLIRMVQGVPRLTLELRRPNPLSAALENAGAAQACERIRQISAAQLSVTQAQ